MLARLTIGAWLLLALAACSTVGDWFKGDPKPGDPAELIELAPTLATRKLWSEDLGKGIDDRKQQLRPAYSSGTFWIADYKGRLTSIDAADGAERWELDTELSFSGGPGLTGELVIMGTENGEVHAFQRDSGTPVWIARVSSEVLAPPTAADGIVVVRSIDGRVFGLNASNGRRLWVYDRSVPLLTLRGNATPVIRAGIVYLGYDSGEVVALRLEDGSLLWEEAIATPEGRSELDRLADVDGAMALVASDLLVSSYKSRLSSVAADSGRLLWFKDIASATGVTVYRTNLATSDREGNVWMLDRRNGSTLWRQDALANRGLTRPVFYDDFVVVGDYEGYLHWLRVADGNFVARTKVGGDGFIGAPQVVGDVLYVYTQKGDLVAFSAGGER
ncbi:MAG: outer membrane protein assembly factor BamB [Xanthomonadales bacterium]|nr:outer membrane protein assembly factor BamB [Xanthomonadales bacterium]